MFYLSILWFSLFNSISLHHVLLLLLKICSGITKKIIISPQESVSGDDNSQQLECQSVSGAPTTEEPNSGGATNRSSNSVPNMPPRKVLEKPTKRTSEFNLPKPSYAGSQTQASRQSSGVPRNVNTKSLSAGVYERHRNVSSTSADNASHNVHEPLQRNLTRIDINDLVQRMEPPSHNVPRGLAGSKWNSVREVAVADAEDLGASMECWVGDQGTDEVNHIQIYIFSIQRPPFQV